MKFTQWILVLLVALTPSLSISARAEDDYQKQALKLNDLDELDAAQKKLTEILKDKATAKKLVVAAVKLHKDAEKEKPFKFMASLLLAKAAHNVKEYETAETFYEFCLDDASNRKADAKILPVFEGLLDLHWEQKNFAGVEQVAKRLIETEGGPELQNARVFALEKMVQAKAKQGNIDDALNMIEGLVTTDKDGWYFVQVKAWVLREAGKFGDAVATYEETIERIDAQKEMKDEVKRRLKRNIRYMTAGVLVDNKDIDKAAEVFRTLIKDEPENATFHNDLGYILADHDKELEEAEKLVRKAIELDTAQRKKLLEDGKIEADIAKKENAAYLDSLGWVLFKLKKYEEAKKYLEKAIQDEEEGRHIEIWDHLADTLVAMGDTKGAVELWTKSLKFDDVSKRDAERRKEITKKMKKYKEKDKE